MTVVRALARPLLSTLFVVQGAKAIRDPEPHVAKAKPVADRLVPLMKRVAPAQVGDRIPESTANLVRLNGAAQVIGGLALASGKGRRLGAVLLAGSLVPTTLAGHSFWQESDKAVRSAQKVQFMKNLGIMGGLLLAAVDTEGRPGLRYRTTHAVDRSQRSVKRAVKTAKRDAKIAALSAAAARKLPG